MARILLTAFLVVFMGFELSAAAWADMRDAPEAYRRGDYSTALKEWRQLAGQGDAEAQLSLGYMYYEGKGVPQNFAEAVMWHRMAAEQGYAEAQLSLGFMYYEGKAVPQNYAEAVRWFRKSAEQGDVAAQYNLGLMYYEGEGVPRDYAEAARWYRKAAEQGYAAAQFSLGDMYFAGKGVSRDYTKAVMWHRKAAEQSYAELVMWYRKGAEQGSTAAQYNLGLMYLKGEGVSQDYVKAHAYLDVAAAQGHDQAREARDEITEKMTPAYIAKAQRLAVACARKNYKGCEF